MDNPTDNLIEFLRLTLESDPDGLQVWQDHFQVALNSAQYVTCERLLKLAKRHQDQSAKIFFKSIIDHNAGMLHLFQGQLDLAEKRFLMALEADQSLNDIVNQAQIYVCLGDIERQRQNWTEARAWYQKSLDYHQHEVINNPRGLAQTHNNMGLVFMEIGEWQEAEEAFSSASHYFVQSENKVETARSLNNLGRLYQARNERQRAAAALRRALEIFHEIDDKVGQASTLNTLGVLARQQGNPAQAAGYYQQSLKIAWETADHVNVAHLLNNLGELARHAGDIAKAAEYYQQSLEMGQQLEDNNIIAVAQGNIGLAHGALDEWGKAICWYKLSLANKERNQDIDGQASTLNNLGVAYEMVNRFPEALKAYQKAVQLYEKVGNLANAAAVLLNIGQDPVAQLLAEGQQQQCVQRAVSWLETTEETDWLEMAQQLLAEIESGGG